MYDNPAYRANFLITNEAHRTSPEFSRAPVVVAGIDAGNNFGSSVLRQLAVCS